MAMRGVWVLCALLLWLCEGGAQKPPVGTEGKKFTKEELVIDGSDFPALSYSKTLVHHE